ncbi:MAG: RNA polymerase factor sigma-32 [Minwuiales bacterium]|nr:RNA polymerase factor sigma-32 [Minwuiales bacterium]
MTDYQQQIRAYPILDADREQKLARRWRDHGDVEARDQLIGSHLRLVMKMARGMGGYGLPLNDLIAEGNLGLIEAANRFDPDRQVRFATYAIWWIRAALHAYVMRNASIVRIGTTAAQKRLFFNLRRAKAELGELGGGDLSSDSAEAIAERLGVSVDEVTDMNNRMSGFDHSLNAQLTTDGETERLELLVDDSEDQEIRYAEAEEMSHRRDLMREALSKLKPREQDILIQRRLRAERATLGDLSTKYGVSRERIRQIEVNAFGKLQKTMLEAAGAA